MMRLEALQPRRLKKTRWPAYAEEPVPASRFGEQLDDSRRHHPGKILQLYREYIDTEDHPDLDFLVDTFSALGMAFDDDCFFATIDKQTLVRVQWFEYLVHDLWERREDLQPHHAPPLVYAMACLEYRSPVLVPRLLELLAEGRERYSFAVLATMVYALGHLNVGTPDSAEVLPAWSGLVE